LNNEKLLSRALGYLLAEDLIGYFRLIIVIKVFVKASVAGQFNEYWRIKH
jgi:hypothetical protein